MESYSDDALRIERLTAVVSMEVYQRAAERNYAEAEALMEKVLQLREAGNALLERAAVLASEYAKAEEAHSAACQEAFDLAEEDIPW